MDELRDKIVTCASMIKSVDPGAVVIGPEDLELVRLPSLAVTTPITATGTVFMISNLPPGP